MSPNWGDARKEQGFGLLAQFVRVYVCSTTSHAARLRRRSIPNLQKADSVKEHRDENVAIGEDDDEDDDDNCRRQRRRTNSKLCGWVSIVIGAVGGWVEGVVPFSRKCLILFRRFGARASEFSNPVFCSQSVARLSKKYLHT